MITFPHCKINIGLFVTEKRSDGYHNIESVFLPVPWCDVLEIIAAPHSEIRLNTTGIALDALPADNICTKAWKLLHDDFAIPGVDAHLHKNIPSGAGLGGGSSDGAFMLEALDELFELRQTRDQLRVYAARLGSDCQFFIDAQPAFVSGVGDEIMPIQMEMQGKQIVIIHPRTHVGTHEAYGMITPKPAPFDLRTLPTLPVKDWKSYVHNDFEDPVAKRYPVIGQIKSRLYEQGALFASMSGSGSAVYGIFEELPADVEAAFSGWLTWSSK